MNEKRQDNQLKPTYSSSVLIQVLVLKTSRKQWTIEKGGERESGISVLTAGWDDDDDDGIIHIDFLEFVAVKFHLNLVFV